MDWKGFFKFTKVKIIYLIIIALIILISGLLEDQIMYCNVAPCPQKESTLVAQKINSIVTLDLEYINSDLSYTNTHWALGIKNFMQDLFGFSAGTVYRSISFVIGMIIHYLLISVIMYIYELFKKKSKDTSSAV